MSTKEILENNINLHNNNFDVKVDYTNTGEAKNTYLIIGESDLNCGIKIKDKIKCSRAQAIDIIALLESYDRLKENLN